MELINPSTREVERQVGLYEFEARYGLYSQFQDSQRYIVISTSYYTHTISQNKEFSNQNMPTIIEAKNPQPKVSHFRFDLTRKICNHLPEQ